jgi:hypothetical protein
VNFRRGALGNLGRHGLLDNGLISGVSSPAAGVLTGPMTMTIPMPSGASIPAQSQQRQQQQEKLPAVPTGGKKEDRS